MSNIIDKLWYVKETAKEDLSEVLWKASHNKLTCTICGEELDPQKDYSPYNCGWKMVDKYTWICHQCLEHFNYKPYKKLVSIDEDIQYAKLGYGNPDELAKCKAEKIAILKDMIEVTEKL